MAGSFSLCTTSRLARRFSERRGFAQSTYIRLLLLGKAGKAYIAYPPENDHIEIDLSKETTPFQAQWIDPVTGRSRGKAFRVQAGSEYKTTGKDLLWLHAVK
jgi:hypothetical protein